MSDAAMTVEEREANLKGIGCSRKRTEDARFIQGKGNYVDDLKLPGMLFGDFVRSPYGHARIKSIDASAALALPGVKAVLTAADLKPLNLHYMPTLAGDVQAVLAEDKVLFQNQEVAFVIAEDRYIAADAAELVEVDYEALPVLVDPFRSMDPDAPVLREDLAGKTEGAHGARRHHNHIFTWDVGDKEATDQAFAQAEVTIKELITYPRVHPAPMETCACVASMDKIRGELTVYGTFQAPHVVRTVASLLSTIPEHKIHVIAPDIGGGFGNKVGVYPGYVCSIVASIVLGVPVKWVEDRMENLSATAFARDYHMTAELAATRDGRITAIRAHVLADHGAFDACADPSKWPAGFFNICTGSYDVPTAYVAVDGVYTNKAPGGVAYRCSFRVTEAAYMIERAVDILAKKLAMDPVELRLKNFIQPHQFPYQSALGWEYDSGDYPTAMKKAMEATSYAALRAEQQERRAAFARGETRELMGIGVAFFTEIVGAGPTRNCDILGVGMFDSCEIRIHPTGAAIARLGTKSQGQAHETTYAQILATEIGIPADDIMIEEGNTDTAPYGLGTYGSRSTPVAGAAAARVGRKIRDKARKIAAHLLEVGEDDLEFEVDRFKVKGLPERQKNMKEIAWAAYNNVPEGLELGLEAVDYYDPPNMTYPFGAYICVVDIDADTGVTKVRRFYALDDCGTRINPMVIEGQVHGGLTEAFAIAMGQEIRYDEGGNVMGASFMDYFVPTAVETPVWETDHTVTPSPHHPIGAKGVGESPNVGGVPAFSNAVNDAFAHLDITHIQMPHDHWRTWKVCEKLGLVG
ncbi:MAG: carbon-monoxide dehydrogenase large subunit [Kiloniellaceae bacterium]|nr:carbon-monoxide dehydrogenase large subunit [Kiloniellaceae bacterium]